MKKDYILLIFAKDPFSGNVKTRLGVTAASASAISAQFLEFTLEKFNSIPRALWCYPDKESVYFRKLKQSLPLFSQRGDDLGENMKNAIEYHLQEYNKVLLIGTDCPDIGLSHLQTCLTLLDSVKTVFIPAEDGGYVLLGVNGHLPPIFQGISWGTSSVLSESLALLPAGEYAAVEPMKDMDRASDLPYFQEKFPFLFAEKQFKN